MATFNYTVDTNPMANEIKSVSGHVKGTTAAVATMQKEVIIAENKAAEHVCSNVNRGFYTLIRSQITQKMAKLQSEVDSHYMRLIQQRKQLLAIKGRMERDYNMISNRYLKLFNSLNSNLQQRVYELDKPVINFAVKEIEKISNRTKYLTATVPVAQSESLAISQKIIASGVKFSGMKVINSMSGFLAGMSAQKHLTDRILIPVDSELASTTLAVPVIISETNFDTADSTSIEVSVNSVELNKQTQSSIKNTVISNVDSLQWSKETEINREVKSEFGKLLSGSNVSQRVRDMANKMFLENSYQTVQNRQP